MLASINTLVIAGVNALPVKVEVDIHAGLPSCDIVGLASTAVKEARERVRAAIKNSGYEFPNRRITVNLAPADVKKEGSHFDLAIAIGILVASSQLGGTPTARTYLAGELSLDGTLHQIPGVLPMCLELSRSFTDCTFIVPQPNGLEAAVVDAITVIPATDLKQVAGFFNGEIAIAAAPSVNPEEMICHSNNDLDFAEVKGQESAKRALLVAAAGMHNVLMIGPPGGGKTMLARRFPAILPPMNRDEILETTRIYSVSGLLNADRPLILSRPFRSPHKNASSASIIGGGRVAHPGEISLAANGVLYLDELPEFNRDVLEALRQPLEDRIVTVARVQATCTYPANFCLIASMNPCQCGYLGSDSECRCTPLQVQRYLNRVSGPLLDRMDIHVEVPRIKFDELTTSEGGQSTPVMQEIIVKARAVQAERFSRKPDMLNSTMGPVEIKEHCRLNGEAKNLLEMAFNRLHMSARAYDRILKVARSIADLEQSEMITTNHLAEAIHYRSLDRKYWRQ